MAAIRGLLEGTPLPGGDDDDVSYMNAKGIIRTVVCAGVIWCGHIIHWCLTQPETRASHGGGISLSSSSGGSSSSADEQIVAASSTHDQNGFDGWFNSALVVVLIVAVAHNYVHMRWQRSPSSTLDPDAAPQSPKRPATAVEAMRIRTNSRAIFDAADSGDHERLRDLLASGTSGIDWVNSVGRSALVQACAKQKPTVARRLIEAGADCDVTDGQGRDALAWARMWRLGLGRCDDEHAAVVLRLLSARRRRALALRRWRVSARAIDAVSDLWTRTKEARYAPDGPGYEAARADFEDRVSSSSSPFALRSASERWS